MEYRTTDSDEREHEAEAAERAELHDYVFGLMRTRGSNDLMDSLLICANICEARSLLHSTESSQWYAGVGARLRSLLSDVTKESSFGLPDAVLEDPLLYYPPTDLKHH